MGDNQNQSFQSTFHRFLRVDFQGPRVTSGGGLILVRELDEHLGFGELIKQRLTDSRGKNTKFALADLTRQSVYSRLAEYAEYEDMNDAKRVSQNPTFRLIGSENIWERGAALSPQRGQGDMRLTRQGRRHRFSGQRKLKMDIPGKQTGQGSGTAKKSCDATSITI